jgi:hypothetical protein
MPFSIRPYRRFPLQGNCSHEVLDTHRGQVTSPLTA